MIVVSYLRTVYPRTRKLDQAKIDGWSVCETFEEFVPEFWSLARYPRPQASKLETFSFAPTIFEKSEHVNGRGDLQSGYWRSGAFSSHSLTLMWLDIDNHINDKSLVTMNHVEAWLRSAGLSFLIYTTISHTPAKPKFRVLMPISRPITHPEALGLYEWFNHDDRLGGQCDGVIYDDGDHCFGPPFIGERRQDLRGDELEVDPILATLVISAARERVRPAAGRALPKGQMADRTVSAGVSLGNPSIFNPQWLELLHRQYAHGHRMSILGLLAKCWHKSGGALSFGDLRALQTEMDGHYDGYCEDKYGAQEMERDITSVMCFAVEPRTHSASPAPKPGMAYRLLKMKENYDKHQ